MTVGLVSLASLAPLPYIEATYPNIITKMRIERTMCKIKKVSYEFRRIQKTDSPNSRHMNMVA